MVYVSYKGQRSWNWILREWYVTMYSLNGRYDSLWVSITT